MPYTATQKLMIVAGAVLIALILMFSLDQLMRPQTPTTVTETSPSISASASSSPSASSTP